MHRIIRIKAYEAEHGPHFNDEHARKAVSKMENEDGTRGQHWSLEETTALANQYGIRLDEKINKYDWYVALNSPTTTTSTGARALINGSGDQMVTEEISTGNRYLIYYNKSNGTFQTVNHIIPPTAAA